MTCKSNPINQRNLIFILPKLLTTEDQEGQSDQIITRLRNVKEANNSVFDWDEGFLVNWQGQLLNEVRWTHMQKVIRPLNFRVRSIIITTPFLGSHHALMHILSPVHGRRNRFMTNHHKRKKYMTVEIVSLWWPISTKVCCRMWGSNPRPSACGHSRARVQPRFRAR